MAQRNYNTLIFEVNRAAGDRLLISKVRFHFQNWWHLIARAKQPIHLHVPSLQDYVRNNMGELDTKREFRITLRKEEVQCYFNHTTLKFVFRGYECKSEFKVLDKMVTAETRVKAAIEKRKATRRRNLEIRRQQGHLDDDPGLLEGIRNLFVAPRQNPPNPENNLFQNNLNGSV